MGVHTNMCVLGRPFGIRQQKYLDKNVVLCRDLTDALYDPRDKPFVSHTRGVELVIEHIEKYWCPSIEGSSLIHVSPRNIRALPRPDTPEPFEIHVIKTGVCEVTGYGIRQMSGKQSLLLAVIVSLRPAGRRRRAAAAGTGRGAKLNRQIRQDSPSVPENSIVWTATATNSPKANLNLSAYLRISDRT